jgi:hypothetical protein
MAINVGKKFGKAVSKPPVACSDIILPFSRVGVEIEVERTHQVSTKNFGYWDKHVDNSLRNGGLEFTTKGGLFGYELLAALEELCPALETDKCDVGYPRAGIHLHIDVTDMNEASPTELLNMMTAYMLFERAMFHWAGDWRIACGFCDPFFLSQRDFKNIGRLLNDWEKFDASSLTERNFSKYQAVNFLPLGRFGTLEFRHLPTTFNIERIVQWVNLCLAFKRFGMSGADPLSVLESYGVEALAQAVFDKQLPIIVGCIRNEEVEEAVTDAYAVRMHAVQKPMSITWDDPDNPYLLAKIKDKPARKKPVKEPLSVEQPVAEPIPRERVVVHVGRDARVAPIPPMGEIAPTDLDAIILRHADRGVQQPDTVGVVWRRLMDNAHNAIVDNPEEF